MPFDIYHVVLAGGVLLLALYVIGGDFLKRKPNVAQGVESEVSKWYAGATRQTDRTPGQVLDSLIADVHWLRGHTDVPADAIKALETVAACLMREKAAPGAAQQPVSQGA